MIFTSGVYANEFNASVEIYNHKDKSVWYLCGIDDQMSAGKSASLLVYDSEDKIVYVAQTVVDGNGRYEFKIVINNKVLEEEIYNYDIRLSIDGVDKSDSVTYSVVNNNNVYTIRACSSSISQALKTGDYIKIIIDIAKKYALPYESMTPIVAGYNENEELIFNYIMPSIEVSGSESTIELETGQKVGDDVKYVKVFLIDNLEQMTSLAESYATQVGNFINIYVSPDGSDENEGNIEYPVATLEKASGLAAAYVKAYQMPVNIIFDEGTYFFDSTVILGDEFSGTETCPITYCAKEGAEVIFSAGKTVDHMFISSGFENSLKQRFPENARDKIVEIDLSEVILNENMWKVDESQSDNTYNRMLPTQIYINNSRQRVCRWPNTGYNLIGNVIDVGGKKQNVWSGISDQLSEEYKGGTFVFSQQEPLNWENVKDGFLIGYTGNDYYGQWVGLSSIDKSQNRLTLSKWTDYGLTEGKRWAVCNIPEEADLPGEWYLDFDSKKAYLYPEKEICSSDVISVMGSADDLIRLTNVSHINFRNIIFEKTNGNAMYISNSSNIEITGCEFRHIGRTGVYIRSSEDILLKKCYIHTNEYMPFAAINCGDSRTLKNANIEVTDNLIRNSSLGYLTVSETTTDSSCGFKFTNNTFSGSTTTALILNATETYANYNEVYNMLREGYDAGAIYMGRLFNKFDSEICYNYIHDYGHLDDDFEANFSANGIFLDDLESGIKVIGNIIVANNNNNTIGVKIGGGAYNAVKYNIFANMYRPILLEARQAIMEDNNILTDVTWKDMLFNFPDTFGSNTANLVLNTTTWNDFDQFDISVDHGVFAKQPWINEHAGVYKLLSEIISDRRYNARGNDIDGNIKYLVAEADSLSSRMTQYAKNANISYDVSEEDVFVNEEEQDYRISNEAKSKYNFFGVPDETFDINNIGSNLVNDTEDDFYMNYPENDAEVIKDNCYLSCSNSDFADLYVFEVAEDDNFNNVIFNKESINNCIQVNGLEDGKTYYWRVSAKNLSRRVNKSYFSNSGVYSFTVQ